MFDHDLKISLTNTSIILVKIFRLVWSGFQDVIDEDFKDSVENFGTWFRFENIFDEDFKNSSVKMLILVESPIHT